MYLYILIYNVFKKTLIDCLAQCIERNINQRLKRQTITLKNTFSLFFMIFEINILKISVYGYPVKKKYKILNRKIGNTVFKIDLGSENIIDG
jgi:hypothetical protein